MSEGKSELQSRGWEFYFRGVALDSEGKIEAAIEEYRQAIAIDPQLAEAHYNLGVDLATLGNIEQAIRAWKRAIWLNKDFQRQLVAAFDIDHESREEIVNLSTLQNDTTYKWLKP